MYEFSADEMEEIYRNVLNKMLGEGVEIEIFCRVQNEKAKISCKYELEELQDEIDEQEQLVDSLKRQLKIMHEFGESRECEIIREVCEGNSEHLDELMKMVNNNNRFGIINRLKQVENLKKAKRELIYGCIKENHFVVFANKDALGLYEAVFYPIGNMNFDEDVKNFADYLKTEKAVLDDRKAEIIAIKNLYENAKRKGDNGNDN